MVDFSLWDIFRNLLLAARWTVALSLSLIAFIGGGLIGQALLPARLPSTQPLVAGYVQLFQGKPLLMQSFRAYFRLALVGNNVSAWVAAGLALTLYASAFLTEIWRGCVLAIPKGQWEVADSLALWFTVYACVALMYFLLCWPVSAASRKLERSFKSGR